MLGGVHVTSSLLKIMLLLILLKLEELQFSPGKKNLSLTIGGVLFKL
jgi:hypothetical protein